MSGRSVRRAVLVGAAMAVAIGLAATAHGVFSPEVLARYANSPDSVRIASWAQNATLADALSWWVGSWIQQDSPYYRPLSSWLMWAEYLAFGWDFQGYVVVSWCLHAIACLLLYGLTLRILPGPLGVRVFLSVVAVGLFNGRLGPTGPGWMPAPVAYGVVAWWPGQTDQTSLVCALGSLLALDRWLQGSARRDLTLAIGLWAAAMLCKEMAVCVPLLAGLLAVVRQGNTAVRLYVLEQTPQGTRRRLAPGIAWRLMVPGLLIVAGFLALRSALVLGAWGPKAKPVAYFVGKAMWYVAERPLGLIRSRGPWLVVVALFVAACVYVYVRLPRRPSALWLALALVVGAGALAQVVGGNFALITIPQDLAGVGTVALFVLGLVVLCHVRSALPWTLLGMVGAVHLPILHVQGPHYMYWPSAFWSLYHAALLQWIWERHRDGTLQWPAGSSQGPCNTPGGGQ